MQQDHMRMDLTAGSWLVLVPDAIAVLDADGVPRTVRPDVAEAAHWIHPDDQHAYDAAFARCLTRPGEPTPFTLRYWNPAGEWVPGIGTFVDLCDDPIVDGVLLKCRPTRNSDLDLVSSEQRFRRIVECAAEGVWVVDADDVTVFVNNRLADLLGYTPEEIIGQRLTDLLDDVGRQQAAATLAQRRAGQRSSFVFRYIRRDGTPIWAHVASAPMMRDDGSYDGAVALISDISEQVRIDEARRVSEGVVRTLADIVPVGIFELDPSGTLTYANESWSELFGLTLEQGREHGWYGFVAPEDRAQVHSSWEVAHVSRMPFELRFRIIDGDGEKRWVHATTSTITADDGVTARIVGCVTDVSASVQLEEQLAQACEQAIETSRLKSEFLANMSHEIRTPMNGVIGMATLLLDTALSADQRDRVVTLRQAGEHLLALLNDILDFSKIETGRLELEETDFELLPLVHAVGSLYSSAAFDKGVRLRIDADFTVPKWVRGDPARVRQILTNLVGNAVKFTEAGSVTIRLSSEGKRSPAVRFEVLDTGIGIPEDAQGRIFEAFIQADSSTTRRFGGTGLGLAICRQLVELMGGVLSLSSTPGKGSTFFFTIPFGPASTNIVPVPPAPTAAPSAPASGLAAAAPALATTAPSAGTGAGGPASAPAATDADRSGPDASKAITGKVLLVEDNAINQKVALGFLKHLGYDADVANDGAEAVEAAAKGHYRVILMDCQMPRMDGYEATARIRAHERSRRHTPIIALTAGAMQGDRERCIEAGMDDYVTKPIDVSRLSVALQKWFPVLQDDAADEPQDDEEPVYDEAVIEQLSQLPGSDGLTLFDEVGGLFRNRAAVRVAAVLTALGEDSWRDASEEAHALKGMSASIGARRLAASAAEIEHACKKQAPLSRGAATRLADQLQRELDLALANFPSA